MDLNQRVLPESPFFYWKEFYKPHHNPTPEQLEATRRLVRMLIPFRERFKHAFNVNKVLKTGFRSWEEHRTIYHPKPAPRGSRHLFGDAVDFQFSINSFTKAELDYLRNNWPGGMGFYSWGVHLDAWRRRRW